MLVLVLVLVPVLELVLALVLALALVLVQALATAVVIVRNAHMVELQCTLCVANNDPNATRFKSISKVPPMPPKSDSRNDLVWLCDDCKFLCECVATEATLSMGEVVEMMTGEAATGYQTGEGLVALFASMLKARQERETSARQPQPQSDSDGTGMPGLVDADPWGKDRPEYSDGW